MRKLKRLKHYFNLYTPAKFGLLIFFVLFAVIGVLTLISIRAATISVSVEAETGSVISPAVVQTNSSASGGSQVKFATGTSSGTLPPGSALPSDATCNSRVVHKVEVRPQNATYNSTAGYNKGLTGKWPSRVSGAYTGSTDDILQWVACKWGIEADIVRAQAAKESYWTQSSKGDWTTNAAACPPNHGLGADGTPGQCPESYGLLQVRYQYHGPPSGLNTWPEAETSTAYNADHTYNVWRECYEGDMGWLNTVEHVGTYAAGDIWGCIGVWFSGRWHTPPAETYIQAVKDWKNQRIWEDQGFINYR